MALSAGNRLGPYEIVAPLGAGGMGEVYRAKDTRLGREVAVKVLPQHLTSNPEIRARFEREAKTVSSLNHPHICTLHDVGREGETDYLVMELIEGETLAARLMKGALPLAEVLKVGAQIADALDRAHRAGVMHRDLKPGNVMLTKAGAKLMDFGLARASGLGATSELTSSPTVAGPLTAEGTILGTFQYMAPEQLEGKEADARVDLWALGCVLYEMATGTRAFDGKSQASLIAAIMTTEPASLGALAPMSPPAFERLVKQCLAKDPDDRWQSAGDLSRELSWIAEAGSQAGAPVTVVARRKNRERFAFGLSAALALMLIVAVYVALRASHRAAPFESRVLHVTLQVGKGERLISGNRPFAISPDGSRVALCVSRGLTTKLLIRSLADGTTVEIAGGEDAASPFFSPDGKWIGFVAAGKLKKIAIAGGTPIVLLAGMPSPMGAAWADDGFIYCVPKLSSGVFRVPEGGGAAQPATRVRTAEGEIQHRWPDVAPGGKTIVYAAGYGKEWDEAKIVAERLDTGARRVIVEGGTSPRILPGGILVYQREGSLSAIAFDPVSLTSSGAPVEVAKNVLEDLRGFAYADFSSNGTLLTLGADAAPGDLALAWIDRSGNATPLHLTRQAYQSISLAANGKAAAVAIGNSIAALDLMRETLTKIPLSARACNPVLSPDARTLYFAFEKEKWYQVYSKAADGSGPETPVFRSESSEFPAQVSLDGSQLLTYSILPSGEIELRTHDLSSAAAGEKPKTILRSPYLTGTAVFSPDARWIAYDSTESGLLEVYARSLTGEARRVQISTEGGWGPTWSHNGSEIFFGRGQQEFVVPVKEEGSELRVGAPKLLFENHDLGALDLDPTAKRFLVAENPNFGAPQSVEVTVNWFAEVERKLREAKAP